MSNVVSHFFSSVLPVTLLTSSIVPSFVLASLYPLITPPPPPCSLHLPTLTLKHPLCLSFLSPPSMFFQGWTISHPSLPLFVFSFTSTSLFCSHPLLQQKKKTEEKLRLHSVVVLVCVFCCVAGVLEKNTVRSEVKLTSQCGSPRRHKMVFSLCTISKSLD